MTLKLEAVDFKPLTWTLQDFDVTVTVRRATLSDESKRLAALFAEGDTALITDIATAEIWITLVEFDTLRGARRRAAARSGHSL